MVEESAENPPSFAHGVLIAAAIVVGAGLFGVATSWIMGQLPKDAPHPAYTAELRQS